ncbi:M56 family metallopeptidase [Chitinophaga sp. Mgbs1]|uniref:M56 family metallopeptidase n=1 Tax=Chitinophaga solisilvae TaxID=1233460 RepID=A0A3S1BHJ6_9BACT|nr:M56 family metallopeptidase [Chitinophaga solisilvae]
MMPLAAYLSKMILCSAVLYLYYHIALRNNRFHQWNRYYLVLITLLSLITPLLHIPLPAIQEEPSVMMTYTTRIITLRESVTPAATPADYLRTGVIVIYSLVALLLTGRLLISIIKIRRLIRHSQVTEIPPYRFARHNAIQAPFSFFRYIFWDLHTPMDTPAGKQILRHELVHIREKHSTDKLFMEFISAIGWINPFFLLIKRELALIHEFIADKNAAGEEVSDYAQTILQMTFQSKQFAITNDFFHPPIKRRILMLTHFYQPRFSYLRRILVLPVAALIFCSLAFAADKHPSAIRMQAAAGNRAITVTPVADTSTPVKKKQVNTPKAAKETKKVDEVNEVFTFVEIPPSFIGGENELVKYLSANIKYPKAAQEKGTGGTVFAQFIVTREGYITDVRTVGARKGDGLEEEAIRVVKAMPRWQPGVQNGHKVAVLFNLPIRFSTTEEKAAAALPSPSRPIFTFVEQPPVFPGGEEALARYLSKNLQYPAAAVQQKAGGTVFVQFLVEADGAINAVTTVGAKKGMGLEDEAIRVVKAMPKWKPGKQNGREVTVQFNLPVRFQMQ